MSPEISILLPCVLDNIRLAASRGNASVACLPRASPRDAKPQVPHFGNGWVDLYTTFISDGMRLRVRGSYFCVLMNPQTSFTALLSICVVVANTACPPGLNIVNL